MGVTRPILPSRSQMDTGSCARSTVLGAQGFKLNGNLPGQRSLATALHSFSLPSFLFDLHMIRPLGHAFAEVALGGTLYRPCRSSVSS